MIRWVASFSLPVVCVIDGCRIVFLYLSLSVRCVHTCVDASQAVDLPRMDHGALGMGQGIDACIIVKFGGSQLATRTTTIRGKELLHVDFNEQVSGCWTLSHSSTCLQASTSRQRAQWSLP